MRVKIASNMYEEIIDGVTVLYSYSNPVACKGEMCYKTEVKFTPTTSKHINKWGAGSFETKPQDFFFLLSKGEVK